MTTGLQRQKAVAAYTKSKQVTTFWLCTAVDEHSAQQQFFHCCFSYFAPMSSISIVHFEVLCKNLAKI